MNKERARELPDLSTSLEIARGFFNSTPDFNNDSRSRMCKSYTKLKELYELALTDQRTQILNKGVGIREDIFKQNAFELSERICECCKRKYYYNNGLYQCVCGNID